MTVTGRGLSLSPQEGEEERMAEEQVSVQRFYPSSPGQAQGSVTSAQGSLTTMAAIHSGRNGKGSALLSENIPGGKPSADF